MRFGVIGAGSIGSRHIRDLLALNELDVHVLEPDIRKQEALIIQGRTVVHATLRELYLARPQVIFVCTPPEFHIGQALEAIRNGCYAFIEKPLSLGMDEIDTLRDLLKTEQGIGHVAVPWRFHPGPLALKRWLDEGAIGEVLSARISMGYYLPDTKQDYQNSYAATTGVTLDVGSHAVDLALWLLGPARLCSAVVRLAESIGLKGTDGLAELLLEHKSGAVSSVRVSFVDRERHIAISLNSSQGVFGWSSRTGLVYKSTDKDHETFRTIGLDKPYHDDGIDQMYVDELAHFLTCVRENRPTCNPVSSAVDVLRILLKAKQCHLSD